MKVIDCIQGSQEWLEARAGIPTASEFSRILTPGGARSKSQEKYQHELIAERILGRSLEQHVSWYMKRGSEAEHRAVSFYELQRDVDTIPVGFLMNDTETAGASPDRFVDEDGSLEIKCPSEGEHIGFLLKHGSLYQEHKPQVNGQLLISGRDWADLVSWHPILPEALHRIERDEAYIGLLDEAVQEFCANLESLWAKCIEDGLLTDSALRRKPLSQQDQLINDLKSSLRKLKQVTA